MKSPLVGHLRTPAYSFGWNVEFADMRHDLTCSYGPANAGSARYQKVSSR